MPENTNLKSRFEIYMEAALNSIGTEDLPKPSSRGDEYLLALVAKLHETKLAFENIEILLNQINESIILIKEHALFDSEFVE